MFRIISFGVEQGERGGGVGGRGGMVYISFRLGGLPLLIMYFKRTNITAALEVSTLMGRGDTGQVLGMLDK